MKTPAIIPAVKSGKFDEAFKLLKELPSDFMSRISESQSVIRECVVNNNFDEIRQLVMELSFKAVSHVNIELSDFFYDVCDQAGLTQENRSKLSDVLQQKYPSSPQKLQWFVHIVKEEDKSLEVPLLGLELQKALMEAIEELEKPEPIKLLRYVIDLVEYALFNTLWSEDTCLQLAKYVIDKLPNINEEYRHEQESLTPLFMALRLGSKPLDKKTKDLVKYSKDECSDVRIDLVKYLLDKGADIHKECTYHEDYWRDDDFITEGTDLVSYPLQVALQLIKIDPRIAEILKYQENQMEKLPIDTSGPQGAMEEFATSVPALDGLADGGGSLGLTGEHNKTQLESDNAKEL